MSINILGLPAEINVRVFQYVNEWEDMSNAACVCKIFKDVVCERKRQDLHTLAYLLPPLFRGTLSAAYQKIAQKFTECNAPRPETPRTLRAVRLLEAAATREIEHNRAFYSGA